RDGIKYHALPSPNACRDVGDSIELTRWNDGHLHDCTNRWRPRGASIQQVMSKKKERVVIVDDHPLFRERLSELINHELDMEVARTVRRIRVKNSAKSLLLAAK